MRRVCRAAGIGSKVERPLTSNEKPAELLPFAAAAALAWYSCSIGILLIAEHSGKP